MRLIDLKNVVKSITEAQPEGLKPIAKGNALEQK
jgi:hypothetical protein